MGNRFPGPRYTTVFFASGLTASWLRRRRNRKFFVEVVPIRRRGCLFKLPSGGVYTARLYSRRPERSHRNVSGVIKCHSDGRPRSGERRGGGLPVFGRPLAGLLPVYSQTTREPTGAGTLLTPRPSYHSLNE